MEASSAWGRGAVSKGLREERHQRGPSFLPQNFLMQEMTFPRVCQVDVPFLAAEKHVIARDDR